MFIDLRKNQLLAKLKVGNSLSMLYEGEYIASAPKANDGSQDPSLTKNTYLRITPNELSTLAGTTVISYDRIDLAQLFEQLPKALVVAYGTTTIRGAAASLTTEYGLVLDEADIEDGPFVPEQPTITFKATPTAFGVTGEATLTVLPAPLPLDVVVTETTMNGINPPASPGMISAYYYSYPLTFTSRYADLIGKSEVELDKTLLAEVLTTVTGDVWTNVPYSTSFNLDDAVVSYAGSNAGRNNNEFYAYVVEIDLGVNCDNMEGKLVMQYNEFDTVTIDPTKVIQD